MYYKQTQIFTKNALCKSQHQGKLFATLHAENINTIRNGMQSVQILFFSLFGTRLNFNRRSFLIQKHCSNNQRYTADIIRINPKWRSTYSTDICRRVGELSMLHRHRFGSSVDVVNLLQPARQVISNERGISRLDYVTSVKNIL